MNKELPNAYGYDCYKTFEGEDKPYTSAYVTTRERAQELLSSGYTVVPLTRMPTDEEVHEWFVLNISPSCSASSGIYKFRLWLEELARNSNQR